MKVFLIVLFFAIFFVLTNSQKIVRFWKKPSSIKNQKIKNGLKTISGALLIISFFGGIIFLILRLIYGGYCLSCRILPSLLTVGNIVFVIDILLFLPLALFKKSRKISSWGFVLSSYVYGLTAWVASCIFAYEIWGIIAVVLGVFFSGIGVIPVALLALAISREWLYFVFLLIWIATSFGAKVFGFFLEDRCEN